MDTRLRRPRREEALVHADDEELSKRIKELAARNEITIELTPEQADAIRKQWTDADPRTPARLRFVVETRDIAELAVAGYRYQGDTCCV
jgi:hypothetical protein